MSNPLLDNPLIASVMFYPRKVKQGTNLPQNAYDGIITASDGTAIGYRLYDNPTANTLLLFFHGNGEVAADYGDIIQLFHKTGAAVLIADFRGYGWSEGTPSGSALLTDAEDTLKALPEALKKHRPALVELPVVVMGRSLGSAPASYLASKHADRIKGIIIESGFASGRDWLLRKVSMGMINTRIPASIPDPLPNAAWVAQSGLPLLVIHGENDTLIPPVNGQTFFDLATNPKKHILRIPRAGHNDLMLVGRESYFGAIENFIKSVE